jgi:hypothetical protein
MPKLNWKIISGDVKEAREQIEEIEKRIAGRDRPSEGELLIMFEHAYHHLNVAWNARSISTKRYANLTDAEFNKWSQYPKDISGFIVPSKTTAKRKSSSNKPRPQRRAKGGA